ncbi:unnamed protein product [Protopolystoma xenopodis]|uniref:CUB domain-containing protein n=1 Tax=Protopolystoma xenopodis TaxID=117903 RepID=A0A3S5B8W5_9PLAT|nr:unnamed protein product [Protopolystoma xenopodis]
MKLTISGIKLSRNLPLFSICYAPSSSLKGCSVNIRIKEGPLEVYSLSTAGYPESYLSDMDCSWLVEATSAYRALVVELMDVALESSYNCKYDSFRLETASSKYGSTSQSV